mmetsp:Transcript_20886/g.45902  ORF Transcript_20886/g.45902 Transcript_20886/m.45902 type:complete len:311 (-) Transcript_20886:1074-2006(-)
MTWACAWSVALKVRDTLQALRALPTTLWARARCRRECAVRTSMPQRRSPAADCRHVRNEKLMLYSRSEPRARATAAHLTLRLRDRAAQHAKVDLPCTDWIRMRCRDAKEANPDLATASTSPRRDSRRAAPDCRTQEYHRIRVRCSKHRDTRPPTRRAVRSCKPLARRCCADLAFHTTKIASRKRPAATEAEHTTAASALLSKRNLQVSMVLRTIHIEEQQRHAHSTRRVNCALPRLTNAEQTAVTALHRRAACTAAREISAHFSNSKRSCRPLDLDIQCSTAANRTSRAFWWTARCLITVPHAVMLRRFR